MKNQQFKDTIKSKVKDAAFKYLLQKKNTHTKMNNIRYSKLELQEYLNCPLFGTEQAQMLLALRTRTVRGIKSDFKGMFQDILCSLGCGNPDTLQNILTYTVLKKYFKTDVIATENTVYEDIFSTDVQKQKRITELYTKLFDIRENLINNPVKPTGPCIDLQRLCILSA